MTQYNFMLIAGGYVAMSLVTLGFYGIDKYRAVHGKWRISERTLHGLELLGGWPGALLAQALFHHKQRKLGFMLVFAGIITLHVAIWVMIFRLTG
jgi:uncharacterized membrane protein YsdA (DUF1294 family)